MTPRRIFAIAPSEMTEAWEYSRPGERYHHAARNGRNVFVVYTHNWIDSADPLDPLNPHTSHFRTLDRRTAAKVVYTKRF